MVVDLLIVRSNPVSSGIPGVVSPGRSNPVSPGISGVISPGRSNPVSSGISGVVASPGISGGVSSGSLGEMSGNLLSVSPDCDSVLCGTDAVSGISTVSEPEAREDRLYQTVFVSKYFRKFQINVETEYRAVEVRKRRSKGTIQVSEPPL